MRAPRLLAIGLTLILFVAPIASAAFDDGARYTFVESAVRKEIYVLDLQSRSLAHTIQLTHVPDAVAVSAQLKALVISHEFVRRLTLIDLSAGDLTQIDYPLELMPGYVAVDPSGETVLIYDREAGKLEVHALRRGEVLLSAGNIDTTTDFTFSGDGTRIYWTDEAKGTFNYVDLWSRRSAIELAPGNSNLSAASRSIDGALAFVSDASANVVHVVNLATFEPLMRISVGSQPGRPWGTSDGRYMLVPNHGDGTVSAISTLSGKSEYTVPAVDDPVFISPGWIDTTAAAVGKSGEVDFLDIESGQVMAHYELGGVPATGVVTSDSRTLAIPVSNKKGGRIAFFDMRERSLISQIDGLGPDLSDLALAVSNNLCH